jgi:hypothetical protein
VSAPTRRALLAGAGAAAALPALAAPAAASPGPDADLIRICAEHIANRDAFNASPIPAEPDNDPLWQAYCRTYDAIEAAKPQTIDGVLAKARATAAEGEILDETGFPTDPTAQAWAWEVVNDLLRLYGGAT